MRKTAIFVEGDAELIFVREFLLILFEYQNVEIECRKLNYKLGASIIVDYDFPANNAQNHFHIINVGNDVSVVSQMNKNAQRLRNVGYSLIVGLRDMFSEQYIKECAGNRVVQNELNAKFIEGHQNSLSQTQNIIKADITFAIMEIEAWILGMPQVFEKKHNSLTIDYIKNVINIDLQQDPESIFHPAVALEKILNSVGLRYGKHEKELESLLSKITREDYFLLLESEKCMSFNRFKEKLLENI